MMTLSLYSVEFMKFLVEDGFEQLSLFKNCVFIIIQGIYGVVIILLN